MTLKWETDSSVNRTFRLSVDTRRRQVFDGANEDVLTEIGYLREKICQFERHRKIDLGPMFWSLENTFVEKFYSSDPAEAQIAAEKLEKSIEQQKRDLSSVNKMIHYVNSLKAVFEPSLQVFPDMIIIPDENAPNRIHALANSIQILMKRYEEMTTKNTESKWKLAALDEKIFKIRHGLKEFEDKSKNKNVASQLGAVEMQNSMLNELLSKILDETTQVQAKIKELDSQDEKSLKRHIREATTLNLEILNDAFPGIESNHCCLSQWQWMPQDVERLSFNLFVKTLYQNDPLDENIAPLNLRKLKRDIAEITTTRRKVDRIRRKFQNARQMKMQGIYGSIQYSLELPVSSFSGFNCHKLASASMQAILDASTDSQIVALRCTRPENLFQLSALTSGADSKPIIRRS